MLIDLISSKVIFFSPSSDLESFPKSHLMEVNSQYLMSHWKMLWYCWKFWQPSNKQEKKVYTKLENFKLLRTFDTLCFSIHQQIKNWILNMNYFSQSTVIFGQKFTCQWHNIVPQNLKRGANKVNSEKMT